MTGIMASELQGVRERIARRYRAFAEREAVGRSPLYATFAERIAADPDILGFLEQLPEPKQQPNLLLGAVKFLFGAPKGWDAFKHLFAIHADEIRAVMMRRSTQTNEAARCATLLPVLALLPQPLALLEVGASAGLCLQPDRYAYDYGDDRRLAPTRPLAPPPVLRCVADARVPIPTMLPEIIWRAGLDLDPVDINDSEQTTWLEALMWPEQHERLARLRAAIAIARHDPPRLKRGDLLHDLAPLAAEAPDTATLVIFHSAVLGYVTPQAERDRFAQQVGAIRAVWIANESPNVFPQIAAKAGTPPEPGNFLLAVNGAPVAWTDHHGASIRWIANP